VALDDGGEHGIAPHEGAARRCVIWSRHRH